MDIQHYFWEINKYGYVDDDIRCEDNKEITKSIETIVNKYKRTDTIASKIIEKLGYYNYLHEFNEELYCYHFTLAYLIYNK